MVIKTITSIEHKEDMDAYYQSIHQLFVKSPYDTMS